MNSTAQLDHLFSPIEEDSGSQDIWDESIEVALLAALFHGSDKLVFVDNISADDFYHPAHRAIFTALSKAFSDGRNVSFISLKGDLKSDPDIIAAGGEAFIRQVVDSRIVDLPEQLQAYADIIRDHAVRRRMLDVLDRAKDSILNPDAGVGTDDVQAQIIGEIEDMSHEGNERPVNSKQNASEILEDILKDRPKFSTGIRALDEAMGGGIYVGKLYGFGGRKKSGKTILAATISHRLNLNGVKHSFICTEMGRKEIHQRQLAWEIQKNCNIFLHPEVTRNNKNLMNEIRRAVSQDPGNINWLDRRGLKFRQLKRLIAIAAKKYKSKVIFLDYFQMVGGHSDRKSKVEQYEEVADWLAYAARQFDVAIITTAQLNQEGNIKWGEGLRCAADQVFAIQNCEHDKHGRWIEMMDSRYTKSSNVGNDTIPAVWIHPYFGPLFTETPQSEVGIDG